MDISKHEGNIPFGWFINNDAHDALFSGNDVKATERKEKKTLCQEY